MNDTVTETTIHELLPLLDPEHRDREPTHTDIRAALLLIHQTQAERGQLEITAREIALKYTQAIAALLARENQARRFIQEWLTMNGQHKVSFPDAGAAHLRTQPAAIEIDADTQHVAAVAAELGAQKTVADTTQLKKVLLDRLLTTGEALPPGFTLRPEQKTVVISL